MSDTTEAASTPADEPAPEADTVAAADQQIDIPIDELDVETLVTTLETVTAERDSHLADLQRITAEFSNFRRQATKRQTDFVDAIGEW